MNGPSQPQPLGGTFGILVPMSPGELIDRITILEIKDRRITAADKRGHVQRELRLLETVRDSEIAPSPRLDELTRALRTVNEALWQIEDDLRVCEQRRDFGPRFIGLARSVYHRNDERADLKRAINELLGAPFQEQKAYAAYTRTENQTNG